jgi:hypothetical protein
LKRKDKLNKTDHLLLFLFDAFIVRISISGQGMKILPQFYNNLNSNKRVFSTFLLLLTVAFLKRLLVIKKIHKSNEIGFRVQTLLEILDSDPHPDPYKMNKDLQSSVIRMVLIYLFIM